jgi:hypothetical protein
VWVRIGGNVIDFVITELIRPRGMRLRHSRQHLLTVHSFFTAAHEDPNMISLPGHIVAPGSQPIIAHSAGVGGLSPPIRPDSSSTASRYDANLGSFIASSNRSLTFIPP